MRNKTDYKKIRIPSNYVLVLPDPVNDTYQLNGKETGILVGISAVRDKSDYDNDWDRVEETVDTAAQHFSIKGKVYAVPEKLTFNGKRIKKSRLNFSNDSDSIRELGQLMGSSLEFDTSMDVEVGDEVVFDYLEHIGCYEDGRWIETELGDMYLIRYDSLYMAVKKDGSYVPLNGMIMIEEKNPEKITENGLILPMLLENENKIEKWSCAEVELVGTPLKGYKQDLTLSDDRTPIKKGDTILFRPGGSYPLEWVLHQKLFPGRKIMGIRRKDIFMVIPNNPN